MNDALQTVSLVSPGSSAERFQAVLRRGGWEVEQLDLDLTGERPAVNIRISRRDGRWLFARVDARGRSCFETFQRARTLGMDPRQKGRRPLTPLIEDRFLGRQRFDAAITMLESMTHYLVDNALAPVALADVRAAWTPMLQAPASLGTAVGHRAPGLRAVA